MFLCWTIRIFSSIPHTSTRLLSAVVMMSFDRNDTFSEYICSSLTNRNKTTRVYFWKIPQYEGVRFKKSKSPEPFQIK